MATRRGAALLPLLGALLGCAAPASGPLGPLAPALIRSRLAGRTFDGFIDGQRFRIQFAVSGSALLDTGRAEYVHWWANESGLCLARYGQSATCMPVFQASFASYDIGGARLNSESPL